MMTLTYFPVEDEWFDDDLPVQRVGGNSVEAALGIVPLKDFDLVNLSGAMRGSTLICEEIAWPYDVPNAQQSPALSMKVTHAEVTGANHANEVVLFVNGQYQAELYIEFMAVKPSLRGQGIAPLAFWRIARAANILGIERITLNAIGGRTVGNMKDGGRWSGYYFWPSIGFDGDIRAEDRQFIRDMFKHYPPNLAHVSRVRDVFEAPDGAAFWKLCGGNVRILPRIFSVLNGSPSTRSAAGQSGT